MILRCWFYGQKVLNSARQHILNSETQCYIHIKRAEAFRCPCCIRHIVRWFSTHRNAAWFKLAKGHIILHWVGSPKYSSSSSHFRFLLPCAMYRTNEDIEPHFNRFVELIELCRYEHFSDLFSIRDWLWPWTILQSGHVSDHFNPRILSSIILSVGYSAFD